MARKAKLLSTARYLAFPLVMVLCALDMSGQVITGARTRYSDSFRQWILLTDSEDVDGTLEQRWEIRNDWSEWDLRLDDLTCDIRMKWKDDPNLWQVTCNGEVATARTVWPGDFREWRISGGKKTVVWKSRYGNVLDEWVTRDTTNGSMYLYTYYERDPRDWVLEDAMHEDVSISVRVAMLFLALFHSSPRV